MNPAISNKKTILCGRSNSSDNIRSIGKVEVLTVRKPTPKPLNKSSSCGKLLPQSTKHEIKIPLPKCAWSDHNIPTHSKTSDSYQFRPPKVKKSKARKQLTAKTEVNRYLDDLEEESKNTRTKLFVDKTCLDGHGTISKREVGKNLLKLQGKDFQEENSIKNYCNQIQSKIYKKYIDDDDDAVVLSAQDENKIRRTDLTPSKISSINYSSMDSNEATNTVLEKEKICFDELKHHGSKDEIKIPIDHSLQFTEEACNHVPAPSSLSCQDKYEERIHLTKSNTQAESETISSLEFMSIKENGQVKNDLISSSSILEGPTELNKDLNPKRPVNLANQQRNYKIFSNTRESVTCSSVPTSESQLKRESSSDSPSITIKVPNYPPLESSKYTFSTHHSEKGSRVRPQSAFTSYKPRGKQQTVPFCSMFSKPSDEPSYRTESCTNSQSKNSSLNLVLQTGSISAKDKNTILSTRSLLKQQIQTKKTKTPPGKKIPLRIILNNCALEKGKDCDERIFKSIEKQVPSVKTGASVNPINKAQSSMQGSPCSRILSPPKFMISSGALKRFPEPEITTQISQASPISSDVEFLPDGILEKTSKHEPWNENSKLDLLSLSGKEMPDGIRLENGSEYFDCIADSSSSELTECTGNSTRRLDQDDNWLQRKKKPKSKSYPVLLTRRYVFLEVKIFP